MPGIKYRQIIQVIFHVCVCMSAELKSLCSTQPAEFYSIDLQPQVRTGHRTRSSVNFIASTLEVYHIWTNMVIPD